MALQMRHALDLGGGFPRVALMIKKKKKKTHLLVAGRFCIKFYRFIVLSF